MGQDVGKRLVKATEPTREDTFPVIRKMLASRKDTSWHDSMVSRANRSFQKNASKRKASKRNSTRRSSR